MQQQKHNVLVPAKRKHMRPQRHLARKIKTSLQRCRQRTTKLPFAHRTNQNPNPRRFNSHNLLPRHPKPLGEDRAQALVALNNIPKRSFQRSHIQRATKPNRQRDHVTPARPSSRSKNHSRRCPYDNGTSPGRSTARNAGRAAPASPNRSTSPATVGASNRLRIETSTSRLERMRLIRRVANSEWPPSAKKSSSIPTRSNPNTSANSAHSNSSRGLRAKRTTEARTCGAGSAPRSSFPFAVSGRRSKTTIADGTM